MIYGGTLHHRAACAVGLVALVVACGHEDWGGPKGPPIPEPAASEPWHPPDGGQFAATAPATGAATSSIDGDAGRSAQAGGAHGDAGVAPLAVHIDGELHGGKLAGWEETVASMRPALRACVQGKGERDASVEVTALVGPKGRVLGTDKTGGSQFAEGAVPCIMHEIEKTAFSKPLNGTPKVTVRVRMRQE